jgi:pimeloyl-ACP methyl ester carboxylesterase
MSKLTHAVIPITGFLQGDKEETGFEHACETSWRKLASDTCTVYQPQVWTAKSKPILDQLARWGVKHVFILAYSHGQALAMELAREAPKHGIKTVTMCLCDPVGRNPLLPRWQWAQALSARSLTPFMTIRVPDTVRRVTWCRQYVNLPRAHDLAWNPMTTRREPALVIDCDHSAIQWHHDWMQLAGKELWAWVNPPKAIPVK